MTVDFDELWHVGVVVGDLESAMDQLARSFGHEWSTVLEREVAVHLVGGEAGSEQSSRVRWTASRGGPPQWEVIEAESGLWSVEANPGGGLHHLAYWSDDLAGDSAELQAEGYRLEAWGDDEHGATRFIYLLGPNGLRIEIGAAETRPAWEEWTSGGDYGIRF
ncbi:VOC family protein [Nocardioides aquiterrae]|uniref:VOC domain-containing protein n=1 Tax=Nocardioides aquiterrae TaxID=203799 RepID=A0ABP4F9V8_9ACTN